MFGHANELPPLNRVEIWGKLNEGQSLQEGMRKAHNDLFAKFPEHRISSVRFEPEPFAGRLKGHATLYEIGEKEYAHGTGWAIAKLNRDEELRRYRWPKGDYLFLLRRSADLHGHTLKLESDELRDLLKEPFVPRILRVSASDDTCEPYDISQDIAADDWAIN